LHCTTIPVLDEVHRYPVIVTVIGIIVDVIRMLSRNVRLTRLARCVDLLERRNVLDELGYTYWEAAPGASPSSGPLDPSVGFLTHPLERRIVD